MIDDGVVGVFVPIIMFLVIGVIWIYALKTRNQERMSLIEKGIDPQWLFAKKKAGSQIASAKWGMLLIGLGLGLCAGLILSRGLSESDRTGIVFGSIFLFGGMGLLAFYLIFGKKVKD